MAFSLLYDGAMTRYLRWLGLLLGVVLDAATAVLIAIFVEPREWLATAGFIFLALVFLPALLSLWAGVKAWLVYRLLLRATMVKAYKHIFRTNSFPDVPGHYDIDGYLSETVDDPNAEVPTRTKAAFIAGELSGLRTTKPFTMGMMASFAAEAALSKYQDESWRQR